MNAQELLNFIQDPDSIKKIGIAPLPIRAGALVLIIAIILALGWWKVISPAREEITKLETKELELKQTFERQSRKAANLAAYQEQLDEMKRSFGAMLRQLPNKTEVESLLVDLSQTSAANSLKVEFFKPQGEVAKEFYAEYPIDLRVYGKYHELAKFVSDVAALPRIVTLGNISIKPRDKSTEGDLVMEMVAKTYRYLDDSDEVGSTASPAQNTKPTKPTKPAAQRKKK
ncbi:MAG: type 4a pilus biogenesis protein PilO [Gammaproteobacteria bacterium]|nr:type 4a pilus biogenesis protein PilO [Gammaproteobacteria bacterium]